MKLTELNSWQEYADFYANYNGDFEKAWKECHRGDWMLWIAFKLNVDIHALALAAGLCVKTIVHLMKDERSINAVNATISFGKMR